MATNGAMPKETPPSPVANPGLAAAAATSIPPSDVGEATQLADQPAVDTTGQTVQSQPEATVPTQSVSSSSAAPATTVNQPQVQPAVQTQIQPVAQPQTQPTFTAAELEDNITRRLMVQ